MVETAPVTQPCAAGYSGWLGVTPKGVHDGSPVSAGLPPPARIAVTGRQKLNENLASQQPMTESANPAHSMAIKRAVWAACSPTLTPAAMLAPVSEIAANDKVNCVSRLVCCAPK